jgi:hypothetical protein
MRMRHSSSSPMTLSSDPDGSAASVLSALSVDAVGLEDVLCRIGTEYMYLHDEALSRSRLILSAILAGDDTAGWTSERRPLCQREDESRRLEAISADYALEHTGAEGRSGKKRPRPR